MGTDSLGCKIRIPGKTISFRQLASEGINKVTDIFRKFIAAIPLAGLAVHIEVKSAPKTMEMRLTL
jgi:hypothetical protein